MSEKLAFRSVAIFGSATFTIVMSSSNMNVPTQTTISVHHLRSISSQASRSSSCRSARSGATVHRNRSATRGQRFVGQQMRHDRGDLGRLDPPVVIGLGYRLAVGGRVD